MPQRAKAERAPTEDAERLIRDSIQDEEMVVGLIKGQCDALAKFVDVARERFPVFGCDALRRLADDLRGCTKSIEDWQKHRQSYHYAEHIAKESQERERRR